MKLNKLLAAGAKAGGAAACGFGAFISFAILDGGYGGSDNVVIATGVGLATSSVILATQSVKDVVSAFNEKDK